MKNIETVILNPQAISEAEKMMVCAARLTQRGHQIKNVNDFMTLYNKSYEEKTAKTIANLPHPTIQKFEVINVAVIGASRRFLAQITRHQNEVKFMSASLQYSDYSGESDFVIPYSILSKGLEYREEYLKVCLKNMEAYARAISSGVDHDSAGYMAPQSLRNSLIISATPYQWKHMISQRVCRRNTDETRYVMLKIWQQLNNLSPCLFENAGPSCREDHCLEGKMSCSKYISKSFSPTNILHCDFPLLCGEDILNEG